VIYVWGSFPYYPTPLLKDIAINTGISHLVEILRSAQNDNKDSGKLLLGNIPQAIFAWFADRRKNRRGRRKPARWKPAILFAESSWPRPIRPVKIIAMLKKYSWLIAIGLIIVFAIFIHARLLGLFADVDSFYHIKHSWIYRTTGILDSSFPWAQYSVINQYSADLWYGFHILIMPLTLFPDLLDGIAWGELLTTIATLLLVFWAFRRLEMKWAIFWVFAFALATADLLYRLNMLRPHPLSLGLSLVVFAYLAKSTKKYTHWVLLFISFLISWIHLSLSWLPVLIAMVILLFEILDRQKINLIKYLAVLGGLLVGWLLRPNPIGALKLAYVQVAQLLVEKQSALPLRFGRELKPFVLENFVDQHIPLAIFFIGALVFWLWLFKNKRIEDKASLKIVAWSSLVLTGFFAVLTFGVARRSNELMVSFAVIFIGLIFSYWFRKFYPKIRRWPAGLTLAAIVTIILLIFMPIKNINRYDSYIISAFPPLRFQAALTWLNENAQPGEIVFNVHWDRFAEFFFWNHQNYYINGMDPIFQYAYEPASYWKTHFLHIDAAGHITCAMIRCEVEEVLPVYDVLKNDFKASYIVIEKPRNTKLLEYLEQSLKFDKVFEAPFEAVFKIL